MTRYVFAPESTDQTVSWGDASIWAGGIVPNAADADVVIPTIVSGAYGYPEAYDIAVDGGPWTENSITIGFDNTLIVSGTLSVAADFYLQGGSQLDMAGGTLTIGALENDGFGISGYGLLASANGLFNTGEIVGGGLTLSVAGLDNTGALYAVQGNLTVDLTGPAGSAANFANGTLTGGTYDAFGGTLALDFGGGITVDNADIELAGNDGLPNASAGAIDSFGGPGGTLDLQATLGSIAAAGTLDISFGAVSFAQAVSVGGLLLVDGGSFSAPSVSLGPGGELNGVGLVQAPITDHGGSIVAGSVYGIFGTLDLAGAIGGYGELTVGQPQYYFLEENAFILAPATLEIGAADSLGVSFASGAGTLILDDAAQFSGTIAIAAPVFADTFGDVDANVVQLGGLSLADVTGYTYTATGADNGVLLIDEASAVQTLAFTGMLDTASFALTPGQPSYGSGTPSVDITVTPEPQTPFTGVGNAVYGGASALAIVDSATATLYASAAAGTTLSVLADGVPDGQQSVADSPQVGTSDGLYSLTLTAQPLAPGFHTLTVTASNSAGTASSVETITLLVLPDPVNGVSVAPVDSLGIARLENAGYALQLSPGTEALQLTDGTFSVGEDTGDAFLQRLYEGLLDRPGDTAGLENNAAELSVLGTAALAGAFLTSAEFRDLHPDAAGMSNTAFVTFLYESLLGRSPDSAGLQLFVGALLGGLSRGAATAAIAESPECKALFQFAATDIWVPDRNGAAVTALYRTALGRAPDEAGLQADTGALQHGATLLQIAEAIAASTEYAADHGSQNATALIDSFYENGLGREPDPAGLADNLAALGSGASQASILLGIAASPEAAAHLLPAV